MERCRPCRTKLLECCQWVQTEGGWVLEWYFHHCIEQGSADRATHRLWMEFLTGHTAFKRNWSSSVGLVCGWLQLSNSVMFCFRERAPAFSHNERGQVCIFEHKEAALSRINDRSGCFCVLAVSVQPPVSTYLKHPVNQSDASVTALHLTSLSLPHFESPMVPPWHEDLLTYFIFVFPVCLYSLSSFLRMHVLSSQG